MRTIEGKASIVRPVLLAALLATGLSTGFAGSSAQAGQPEAKSRPKTVTAPPPAPVAADGIATGVKPIGSPGDWFPIDSYPPEARAASQEGRTLFSLDIDAAGRITGCNIVESSGSELLDSTTCSQLILNGKFTPALDINGKPMRGTWKSAMRWQLADADAAKE